MSTDSQVRVPNDRNVLESVYRREERRKKIWFAHCPLEAPLKCPYKTVGNISRVVLLDANSCLTFNLLKTTRNRSTLRCFFSVLLRCSFIPLRLYPRRGSRDILDIPLRRSRFTLLQSYAADVTGGKPITAWTQTISGEIAVNPLVTFYDILGRKGDVLFFYFISDTTRKILLIFLKKILFTLYVRLSGSPWLLTLVLLQCGVVTLPYVLLNKRPVLAQQWVVQTKRIALKVILSAARIRRVCWSPSLLLSLVIILHNVPTRNSIRVFLLFRNV
jgi:hypothetical protein